MKELAKALNSHEISVTRAEKITNRMMKQSNKTNLDFLLNQFSQNGKEKENPRESFYSCFYGLSSSNVLCDFFSDVNSNISC